MADEDSYDLAPPEKPAAGRRVPPPESDVGPEVIPSDFTAGGGTDEDRLVDLLRRGAAVAQGRAMFSLAAGAGVCLGTCGFVAVFLFIVMNGLFGGSPVGIFGLFVLTCVTMLPLLFWTERRTGGEYLADASRGSGSVTDASSRGEYEMAQAGGIVRAATELMLTGPRWVLTGFGLRAGRAGVDRTVLRRAAGVALDLSRESGNVGLGALHHVGDDPTTLGLAIDYLIDQEWIDRSKDGERVWLTSEARKAVRESGIRA